MLGAAIIHPEFREVIPLMPEPIVKPDGTEKNDCERNAAKRFIAKLRQDHPHLKCIITEDSLSSNAPHIETLHDSGLSLYPRESKKAIMPICSSRCRQPKKRGMSPTMSGMTARRGGPSLSLCQ